MKSEKVKIFSRYEKSLISNFFKSFFIWFTSKFVLLLGGTIGWKIGKKIALSHLLAFINFLDNQKIELGYNIVPTSYGFQIDIYGITANCDTDIDTDNTGLEIRCSNFFDEGFVRILGYFNNFENELKYCDDMLFSLYYEGTIIDVRNIIFGSANGADIPIIYYSQ